MSIYGYKMTETFQGPAVTLRDYSLSIAFMSRPGIDMHREVQYRVRKKNLSTTVSVLEDTGVQVGYLAGRVYFYNMQDETERNRYWRNRGRTKALYKKIILGGRD